MPVGLGRDARIAVAEDALDGARVHAGHHEEARSGVAEAVESDATDARLWPELHAVGWAATQLIIGCELRVTAAALAADVLPAFDDARVLERAAEDLFERRVATQHPALGVGKHEGGGRGLQRRPQVRHQLRRDRDGLGVPAFGRLAVVRPADHDEAAGQVDVRLQQAEQLALAQSGVDGRREQRPPPHWGSGEDRADLLGA
ncbi:MAG TPA: hypothetical protein VFX19_09220 [Dehalococcoidia bacterium]|nr:hypothetical protein [Dehalococcoidia bacterium]